MWTIHAYLTYGFQARCVHYAYKTCLTFGPYLTSHHSLELGKVVRNYYNYVATSSWELECKVDFVYLSSLNLGGVIAKVKELELKKETRN